MVVMHWSTSADVDAAHVAAYLEDGWSFSESPHSPRFPTPPFARVQGENVQVFPIVPKVM